MGGPDKSGLSFGTTYCLSATAACVAETSTFPFDITKTRMMLANNAGSTPKGMLGTGMGIVREEGVLGLYKGLGPACLRHVVYSGSRVMVYELLREKVLLKDENGRFPLWKGIVAGFSSGVIGQAIASPTDLVKVQMQADGKRVAAGHAPRYTGIGNAFATIYRQGGVGGLWKGVIPNCQRAGLVQLGDLTTYDAAKQRFMDAGVADGPMLHALSSAVAGLVAATMGTPADVIKTRVMNQPTDPKTGKGLLYTGAADCLRQAIRDEGVMTLYKGWLPNWMRMAPWSLVFFISFEQMRRIGGLDSF